MPETEAAPEAPEQTVQDTPEVDAAPDTGTPAQEQQEAVDYEQRYNDLRPEFDRTTQEREQVRQEALAWQILASSDDEEQTQAAADYLGVDLEPDEDSEDDEIEDDPYDHRLSQLEQAQLDQQEAESQKAFDTHLDELGKGAEVELNKRDRQILQVASEEAGFSPEATEAAFKEFLEERKAYDKAVIDGYVKGKLNAPHVSPTGSTPNEQPDLDDRQARVDWMTERYQMGRQQ